MSKSINLFSIICLASFLYACRNEKARDASGSFEADEVIVSSEVNGKILMLTLEEGVILQENQTVGQIDVSNDKLKAEQIEASVKALSQKTSSPHEQVKLIQKQLQVLQSQLSQLQKEKIRVSNLVKADAATQKQLDDILAQIDQLNKQVLVTKQQLNVQVTAVQTQNRSILSEQAPLQKSIAQIRNQISKGEIISPIRGTVLSKYASKGEMLTLGKPIFKIANMDTMTLRVYITGDQLAQIKLGQTVKVFTDQAETQKEYNGRISWVSSKAEFTPKTILTKNERANLVYATKVRVANDGFLKIGMYGEIEIQ
ncbi:MAG: HlyD family efflux transporter periplasmic adaptor subunit [Chitinophagaceae bacterium]